MGLSDILSFTQGFLLLSLVFMAAVTDLGQRKILNLPSFVALGAGLLTGFLRGGAGELSFSYSPEAQITLLGSLAGALALFFPFFLAYLAGGMGAGDVKLVAGVGALCGLNLAFWVLVHTAIAGAAVSLIWLIIKKDLSGGLRRSLRSAVRLRWRGKDSEQVGEPVRVPYALAICLGTLWSLWFYYSSGLPLPLF